ncbi:MAG: hypothetical protein HQ523_01480 [Lentisphaerae bacterium]|nr:hypothetical protein [Lentisphaerota bacterium]
MMSDSEPTQPERAGPREGSARSNSVCPVCGEALQQESCKVVCRSELCVYRIVFNCSEF